MLLPALPALAVVTVSGVMLWVLCGALGNNRGQLQWVVLPHAVQLFVQNSKYSEATIKQGMTTNSTSTQYRRATAAELAWLKQQGAVDTRTTIICLVSLQRCLKVGKGHGVPASILSQRPSSHRLCHWQLLQLQPWLTKAQPACPRGHPALSSCSTTPQLQPSSLCALTQSLSGRVSHHRGSMGCPPCSQPRERCSTQPWAGCSSCSSGAPHPSGSAGQGKHRCWQPAAGQGSKVRCSGSWALPTCTGGWSSQPCTTI